MFIRGKSVRAYYKPPLCDDFLIRRVISRYPRLAINTCQMYETEKLKNLFFKKICIKSFLKSCKHQENRDQCSFWIIWLDYDGSSTLICLSQNTQQNFNDVCIVEVYSTFINEIRRTEQVQINRKITKRLLCQHTYNNVFPATRTVSKTKEVKNKQISL